jgi:hypothetical protein
MLLCVDSGAVGEVEVGAQAGGENELDAADGLDDGVEVSQSTTSNRAPAELPP